MSIVARHLPSATSAAKILFVTLVVAAAAFASTWLALSHEGHSLYSENFRVWIETADRIWTVTTVAGALSMWAITILGVKLHQALLRGAVALTLALALYLLLGRDTGDAVAAFAIMLGAAGSIAACIFAPAHSWRILIYASIPYAALAFAVSIFALYAPPNTGTLGG